MRLGRSNEIEIAFEMEKKVTQVYQITIANNASSVSDLIGFKFWIENAARERQKGDEKCFEVKLIIFFFASCKHSLRIFQVLLSSDMSFVCFIVDGEKIVPSDFDDISLIKQSGQKNVKKSIYEWQLL